MSAELRFLAPGPLPLAGLDFEIVAALSRIGDGLVYAGRDGMDQARLREYAPARVVRRAEDGTLHPAEPRLAAAWEDASGRFLEQGHRLAAFDHPGVARVWRALALQADGARQGAYLIGAPVGESLAALLAGGLQLSPDQILAIAAEFADVLAALHARGLAHLDISPATVSLASGRLQLTDFAVDNRPLMALLETQAGLVRPGYSPIEHHDASMADPLGPRADVYGASALLFRLISGRDPATWQERWRDPAADPLAGHTGFSADFLAAVRQGMAIEPEERFADGGAWRVAMALPEAAPLVETIIIRPQGPAKIIAPVLGGADGRAEAAPPPPPPPPPSPPQPAAAAPWAGPAAATASWAPAVAQAGRPAPSFGPTGTPPRRNRALPLLLLLGVLLIAALGILAYTQRWFVPADDEPATANKTAPRTPPADRTGTRTSASVPAIEPGATVSGQLGAGDTRRGGGQLEDRFTLEGGQGDRLDIGLSSGDFDPLLTVTGPGFEAANDDDEARGTRDSRLLVTLPRAGRYTISVSSYRRGGTGSYTLEVRSARPAVSIAVPAMLAGRWRQINDEECSVPAEITVEGRELVIRYAGGVTRQQILDGVGRTIRTRPATATDEEEARYLIADDGDGFQVNGLGWVRC